MPLTVGSRLGHYDVTALIGQGGMGEVYRARDTKLSRDVALKVLPDVFADEVLMQRRLMTQRRSSFVAVACLIALFCTACGDPVSDSVVLTADLPLHFEDHLDAATIVGSEVPTDLPEPVEWRFDEPQPDWKPVVPLDPARKPVQATRTEDALRLVLSEANSGVFPWGPSLYRGIYIDLPDWKREEWAHVVVRARTSGEVGSAAIEFNLREEPGSELYESFDFNGEYIGGLYTVVTTQKPRAYSVLAYGQSAKIRFEQRAHVSRGVLAPPEQNQELVTTPSEQIVGSPHMPLEKARDGLEHAVTGLVSEGIIHRLEVVHVDEQYRQRDAVAAVSRQLSVDDFVEEAPVVTARQRISHRQLVQIVKLKV